MLSFAAVHTLSRCLLALNDEADDHPESWDAPPTLLLIHDRRIHPTLPNVREMRAVEFPLHPDDLLADPAGLPALLHRLATDLDHARTTTATGVSYRATLGTVIRLIRGTEPNARLLAWATAYPDIVTASGAPRQVRRIDAVDTDGRVYQLTHLRNEDYPALVVDDTPDPHDTPATQPGLAALFAATTRFIRGDAGRTTP